MLIGAFDNSIPIAAPQNAIQINIAQSFLIEVQTVSLSVLFTSSIYKQFYTVLIANFNSSYDSVSFSGSSFSIYENPSNPSNSLHFSCIASTNSL